MGQAPAPPRHIHPPLRPCAQALDAAADAADSTGIAKLASKLDQKGLTEAQLDDMLSERPTIEVPGGKRTMAWWRERRRVLTARTARRPTKGFVPVDPLDEAAESLQNIFFPKKKKGTK